MTPTDQSSISEKYDGTNQLNILKKKICELPEPEREKTYHLTCASNEDLVQPAHPHSLIYVFVVHIRKRCNLGYSKCAQWRFWSDCEKVQANLTFEGRTYPKERFSEVEAQTFFA